jgi:tetratricopeptide (TPR) repeat protein
MARANIALDKLDDAETSAKATLAESPLHSAALTFLARRALERGETAQALDYTRKATGAEKVGGLAARPSRRDRAEAWALTGQIEQLLEHTREAQTAYEASLAADPLRVDSLIGSGTMLMRMARARDALSRFESALSAHPSDTPDATGKVPVVEASVGAVQALLILERASEALPRIAALSEQYKDHPEVALWLGHTYEALEKWNEAEAAFRRVVQLSPDSFAGYVALSQLLFKRDRPEEGARVLAEATGKVKDSAEVRRMLGHSELTRNHLPEAIHHFEAALRFDAKDAGALLGLTTAQRKSGNLTGAEKSLAQLEKVDPTFAGLSLERGQLLEARGDYSGAANAYRAALEARPHDVDLKLRLGAALVTAGRLEEAEAILPEVLKERPTSAEAEHFVGRLLFAKKETAQAVQHFERSIAFDALRADYHLYLAWAYLDQGNLGAALTSVNKALERDPNLGDARWILGRIQLRTGAVKDAVQNFQLTLKLKPGRVEALANMGDAYDQLRDLSSAIRAYQEAVRQQPENGDWWFRLGTLHLDKGSRDEARVALAEAVLRGDRLIEKPSWLADAHRLYGDVLRESGRVGEALDHYRTFMQLAPPGHPDRGEIERIILSAGR